MAKFKIGDRVKCICACDSNPCIVNKVGTIIEILDSEVFGVEFDENIGGHHCNDKGRPGNCWWCKENTLILFKEFKIGQIYEVTDFHECGNVIEITEVTSGFVCYKTLSGRKSDNERFQVGSDFSNCLKLFKTCEEKIVITTDGKITTAKQYDGNKVVKIAAANCSPKDEFNFATGATIAFSRLFDGDVNFVDDNDSFDWNAFKKGELFVEVTKDNFDDFIKKAEKHDCFFVDHEKVNPFENDKIMRTLNSIAVIFEDSQTLYAPIDCLFVGYQDNSIKLSLINLGVEVFVW